MTKKIDINTPAMSWPPDRGGFAMIHDTLTFSDLTDAQYRIMGALISIQGAPSATNDYKARGAHYIAELVGMIPETVTDNMGELVRRGLVHQSRGEYGKYLYEVLYNPAWVYPHADDEPAVQSHVPLRDRIELSPAPLRRGATARKAKAMGQPDRAKARTPKQKEARNRADRDRRARQEEDTQKRAEADSRTDGVNDAAHRAKPEGRTGQTGEPRRAELDSRTGETGDSLGLSHGSEGLGLSHRSRIRSDSGVTIDVDARTGEIVDDGGEDPRTVITNATATVVLAESREILANGKPTFGAIRARTTAERAVRDHQQEQGITDPELFARIDAILGPDAPTTTLDGIGLADLDRIVAELPDLAGLILVPA